MASAGESRRACVPLPRSCPTRLAISLVASRAPDSRPCRRISRVPCFSVDACCSPYPAGIFDARFGSSRRGCCLHRDMSGSASRLFLYRGCKLHFMLRPASLPPVVHGLLTSRFGLRDPSRLRRPATRRSDAYRGGTCTRGRSAARRLRVYRPVVVFTAHHAHSLRTSHFGLRRSFAVRLPWRRGCRPRSRSRRRRRARAGAPRTSRPTAAPRSRATSSTARAYCAGPP